MSLASQIVDSAHQRIKSNWHVVRLPEAAFFGPSKSEVKARARAWVNARIKTARAAGGIKLAAVNGQLVGEP